MDKIAGFLVGLTEEEKALHRQAFIHFGKCLAGSSPEVVAATLPDGKDQKYKGVYSIMTPFPGMDFQVCIRAAMKVVRAVWPRRRESGARTIFHVFWILPSLYFSFLSPIC